LTSLATATRAAGEWSILLRCDLRRKILEKRPDSLSFGEVGASWPAVEAMTTRGAPVLVGWYSSTDLPASVEGSGLEAVDLASSGVAPAAMVC
jgi:hypothetical protein